MCTDKPDFALQGFPDMPTWLVEKLYEEFWVQSTPEEMLELLRAGRRALYGDRKPLNQSFIVDI